MKAEEYSPMAIASRQNKPLMIMTLTRPAIFTQELHIGRMDQGSPIWKLPFSAGRSDKRTIGALDMKYVSTYLVSRGKPLTLNCTYGSALCT